MWKQEFICRTEDEQFTFVGNPMHIRQIAAIIIAEHNAKFVEISDKKGNVVIIASYNPDKSGRDAFIFAFPEEPETDNE